MCCKKSEMKITAQNMQNFCRTCLEKLTRRKVSLSENELIAELITWCTTAMPVADEQKILPEFICLKCQTTLNIIRDFRCKAEQSLCMLTNIIREFEDTNPKITEKRIWDQCYEDMKELQMDKEKVIQMENCYKAHANADKTTADSQIAQLESKKHEFESNGDKSESEMDFLDVNQVDIQTENENVDQLEFFQNYKLTNLESSKQAASVQHKRDDNKLEDVPKKAGSAKRKTRLKKVSPTKTKRNRTKDKVHADGNGDGHKEGEHADTSGSNYFKYQCDQCPRRFVSHFHYQAHLRVHQGLRPFACPQCESTFTRADHCRTHIREIHANMSPQYKCTVEGCDKEFRREGSYRMHYRLKHKSVTREPKHLMCEECGSVFNNATKFKAHRYKHVPVDEYPYECDECGKRYRSRRSVKEHKLRHSKVKNFVCPYCGMKKTTRNELRSHVNYHTKIKQWPCTKCDKVFNSSGNLLIHDRVVHMGIRAYACKYCKQSFGKPDTLRHHEMRHTGEKPHGCEICGKRFIQSVALRAHMRVHSKERPSGQVSKKCSAQKHELFVLDEGVKEDVEKENNELSEYNEAT